MAFLDYANKVQNGLIGPYKRFLEGAESVVVEVSLDGAGGITVEEIKPEPVPISQEIAKTGPIDTHKALRKKTIE